MCIVTSPRPQRGPDEECSDCYHTLQTEESCAVLQCCRSQGAQSGGSGCKVFDFKLCTRLEIYKQKRGKSRSNPSSLFELLNTVGSIVLILIFKQFARSILCDMPLVQGCSFSKGHQKCHIVCYQIHCVPEQHLP